MIARKGRYCAAISWNIDPNIRRRQISLSNRILPLHCDSWIIDSNRFMCCMELCSAIQSQSRVLIKQENCVHNGWIISKILWGRSNIFPCRLSRMTSLTLANTIALTIFIQISWSYCRMWGAAKAIPKCCVVEYVKSKIQVRGSKYFEPSAFHGHPTTKKIIPEALLKICGSLTFKSTN